MESIFVSSTFRDMHKERDILNVEVLPKINLLLRKEGKSVQFSDLRWGIDTTGLGETESMKKILEICDSEIERCKPYIIVLIGDRYGTPITMDLVSNEDMERVGKSVTHVEIQKGVFQNAERDRIFIYFREMDYSSLPEERVANYKDTDENDIEKLCELKRKLITEYGDRIKTYHASWDNSSQSIQTDDFETIVYEDLKNHIERNIFSCEISMTEQQYIFYNNYVNTQICGIHFAENKLIEAINYIRSNDENVVFYGECGCGKTVFLSKIYKEYIKDNAAVIFLFGQNESSSTVHGFVEYVYCQLLKFIGNEDWSKDCSKLSYNEIIRETAELKEQIKHEICIFVDGIIHCDNHKLLASYINWIRFYFNDNVRFVFSCDDIEFIHSVLGKRCNIYKIEYQTDEIEEIVITILKKHNKTLEKRIISLISNNYSNPLVIQLLIARLVNLREDDYAQIELLGVGIDGINLYMEKIINNAPLSASELLIQIIDIVFEEFEKAQIICVLNYLSISDRGIRECDLKYLVEKNGISWNNIVHANMLAKLDFAFCSNGAGVLDFAHYILKESFYPENIIKYYNDLMDLYSIESGEDAWAVEEFFKYAFVCENQQRLIQFIMDKCIWKDGEKSKEVCRNIASKSIELANENGKGEFLFSVLRECKDVEQQLQYLEIIKRSLIMNRNLVKRKSVVDNVSLMMSMINEIEKYPQFFLQSDCVECKRYLQRNNCYDLIPQVEAFFAGKKVDLDEMVDNEDNSNHIHENISLYGLYMTLCMSKELFANGAYSENEKIVKKLIEKANEVSEKSLEYYIFLGDCYKELGNSLKCQKKWDEAILYDTKYLELYSGILKETSSDLVNERYRVGLYNIANVYELKALCTGKRDDWEKAKEKFEKSYHEESIAIAFENSDQDFLDSFSAIFSYAMSLIKTENIDKGIELFFDAMKFIKRNASAKESNFMFASIVMYELDFLLQSIPDSEYIDVRRISEDISEYIGELQESDEPYSDQLMDAWKIFDRKVSKTLGELFNSNEMKQASKLCSEYVFVAKKITGLFDTPQLFMQLVIICKNWADINYKALNNYEIAEKAYEQLINIIRENNLVVLFAKLGMGEQLSDNICMAFARIINSLVYQNEKEEAIAFLRDNYIHISSLAPITDKYQNLPAFLVYSLARNIEDKNIKRMCADYAIEIAEKANEELESNKKIIFLCLKLKKEKRGE